MFLTVRGGGGLPSGRTHAHFGEMLGMPSQPEARSTEVEDGKLTNPVTNTMVND